MLTRVCSTDAHANVSTRASRHVFTRVIFIGVANAGAHIGVFADWQIFLRYSRPLVNTCMYLGDAVRAAS